MTTPTHEQLLTAVAAVRASLLLTDGPDAAGEGNADAIARRVRDDHVGWSAKHVTVEAVAGAIRELKAKEGKPFEPPKETFPLGGMFPGKPAEWGGVVADIAAGRLPSRVVAQHHAQGGVGSKGSYVLALHAGPPAAAAVAVAVVVVKEAHAPAAAADAFASAVCRGVGLRAPRTTRLSSSEWDQLVEKLRTTAVTIPGTCGALHDSRAKDSGAVAMEFVPGVQLPEALPTLLTTDKTLKDMGAAIAVDMALNNFDRFPLVWTHRGNASNLMVAEDGCSLIDQTATVITDAALEQKYFERIKAFLAEAKATPVSTTALHAKKLRGFVEDASGVDLTASQLALVWASMLDTCSKLTDEVFDVAADEAIAAMRVSGDAPALSKPADVDAVQASVSRAAAFCKRVVREALT